MNQYNSRAGAVNLVDDLRPVISSEAGRRLIEVRVGGTA